MDKETPLLEMNLNTMNDPFEGIVNNTRLNPFQKQQQCVIRFTKLRHEAQELYGTYSIKKINWLQQKLQEAIIKVKGQIGELTDVTNLPEPPKMRFKHF